MENKGKELNQTTDFQGRDTNTMFPTKFEIF